MHIITMRYHATAALLIATLGCAAAEDAHLYRHVSVHSSSLLIPRALLNPGLTRGPSHLKARQSSCLSGEEICADGCIPSSAECCGSDGSFCPSGYYCDGPGCCEDGQSCSGIVDGCPDGTVECSSGDCALEGDCPDGSSGSGSGSGSGSDDGSDSGSDSSPTTTGFGSFPTPTFTRSSPTQTSSSNDNNSGDDDSSSGTNDNDNGSGSGSGNSNGNGNGNGNNNNNGPPRNAGSGLLAPVIGAFFAAFLASATTC